MGGEEACRDGEDHKLELHLAEEAIPGREAEVLSSSAVEAPSASVDDGSRNVPKNPY